MKWNKRKLNDESEDKMPSIILSTEGITNTNASTGNKIYLYEDVRKIKAKFSKKNLFFKYINTIFNYF